MKTFVFFCRGEAEEDIDLESNSSFCEDPLTSRSREEKEGNAKPKSSNPSRSRGPKRPDKPLYMPRAARERLSLQNSQGPSGEQELPSPASSSCISTSSESCSCPEIKDNTKSSSTSRREHLPSVVDSVVNHVADSPALCAQVLTLHEAEPLVWDQTQTCFAVMSLEEDEKDKEALASVACSDVTEEVSQPTLCVFFLLIHNLHILVIYSAHII